MEVVSPKKHPAPFSEGIVEEMVAIINARYGPSSKFDTSRVLRVLDPFAGSGLIQNLRNQRTHPSLVALGLELEPEWAEHEPRTYVGDATDMPFADNSFDIVATSPTYGNRLADHHEAKDGSKRRTYRGYLGRKLHPNNTGRMQWGEAYRETHRKAWEECARVLEDDGMLILNMRDHVRDGARQPVTAWHIQCLTDLGFTLMSLAAVSTPGYGYGSNASARIGSGEIVAEFIRP